MDTTTNSRNNLKPVIRGLLRGINTMRDKWVSGNTAKQMRYTEQSTTSKRKGHKPKTLIAAEVTQGSDTNFYRGFRSQGIFVATWETLPLGTRVRVEIYIEDLGEVLEVEGKVRLIKTEDGQGDDLDAGMGIEFLLLKPIQRKLVDRFREIREPVFYDYEPN